MLSMPMDDPQSQSEMVTIRCPGCGQRFKVDQALQGKMVECGTCDHRFRVQEDVMLRTRKFYPGEHRDPSLERFSRVPLRSSPMPEIETVDRPPEPDPRAFVVPLSPLRIILGLAGGTVAVVVALILIFGGSPGGMLDGAPVGRRLGLAGFAAVLAGVLIVMANPLQRLRAGLGALVIAALLLSLPFFFTQGVPSEDRDAVAGDGGAWPDEPDRGGGNPTPKDPLEEVKQEMGYGPMAEALASYGSDGESQGKTAVGVWLRDTRLFNKEQVMDHLVRTSGAGDRSWAYPRPPSDYLIVLYDVSPDLDRIGKLCERFGTVLREFEEIRVIEVRVDNERFVEGPQGKLQDPDDPDFYRLNLRELESIDIHRVAGAVKRLGRAEPRQFRPDVVERMQKWFGQGDAEMKTDIAKALATWAREDDGSVEMVRREAMALRRDGATVPRPMVEFLVSRQDPGSVDLVHDLWLEDSAEWESLYGELGPLIEERILGEFAELGALQQLSALRLLGRVGTGKSIAALEAVRDDSDNEIQIAIDQALRSIRDRS